MAMMVLAARCGIKGERAQMVAGAYAATIFKRIDDTEDKLLNSFFGGDGVPGGGEG